MATGYEVIFGGWFNTKSIIAQARRARQGRRAEHHAQGRSRHGTTTGASSAVGKKLTWFVDDMQTRSSCYDDPQPLEGHGHEYFGFNNWETDTWFDNLVITPL